MHILIGIGAAVVLLYFWLIGHWFARVLMFLLLGAGFFAGGAAINLVLTGDKSLGIVLALLGVAVAWPVAGIPIYYARFREAQHEKWIAELCARQRQLGEAELREWQQRNCALAS